MSPAPAAEKPIHTIILDAGPIIKNTPPVSTLLKQCSELITTPSIISEIRDPATRTRIETQLLPFVTQRLPKPASFKFVSEFARKTGDRGVLSKEDLEIIALAYEVECERNGGDWRLRREPGQKTINGAPPKREEATEEEEKKEATEEKKDEAGSVEAVTEQLKDTSLEEKTGEKEAKEEQPSQEDQSEESSPDEDSDGGEWITPSNIKKHQVKDADALGEEPEQRTMQVATITSDFAMQNVILQMNLNLLSNANMQRIKTLKSYILRCHACFFTTKDMTKQFCPRCGMPTLNRVSCTTSADGTFRLHLKKNMQWNHRGERFSIPKPAPGSSNKKWKGGGGQHGWGNELILAADQKEYARALKQDHWKRKKEHDLMDDDYLPGILSGQRNKGGGRIKIGAGRNINAKARR